MDRVLLYGLGGHSKVIQMMIKKNPHQILSVIADDDRNQINNLIDLNIIHSSQIGAFREEFDSLVIAIGANSTRKRIAERYSTYKYGIIVDESATIAEDVIIEEGSVVMPKSVINPAVKVGSHCIINSGAIIEHDCIIGDYSHVSPGAVLTGGVTLGKEVHIGANATVLPGITIGDYAIIGAGAVVTKDVSTDSIMVGNPIQELSKLS